MSWQVILVAAMLFAGSPGQSFGLEGPSTVELTCGKLIQVEPVLFNGVPVGGQFERTPIKNAKLRLYHRDKRGHCCKKPSLVAETVTAKDGSFEFRDVEPGAYWIVGRKDWAHYVVAIDYDPNAKLGGKCSELSYELKNGKLKLAKVTKAYIFY